MALLHLWAIITFVGDYYICGYITAPKNVIIAHKCNFLKKILAAHCCQKKMWQQWAFVSLHLWVIQSPLLPHEKKNITFVGDYYICGYIAAPTNVIIAHKCNNFF